GTDCPWLYACGLRPPIRLDVHLGDATDREQAYRVTLHFCDPGDRQGVPAAVDVTLQGETVERGLDVAAAGGGPWRPVARPFRVRAGETLALEVKGVGSAVLCGVDIHLEE
ncbi:MAG: hypothetical protein JXR77_02995, partial [Lentisphaeria bacterium]|nr:hypothetical protein [Lentisphaeria bacterium]